MTTTTPAAGSDVPSSMQAWHAGQDTTPRIETQPVPEPAADEVLVRIRAAALNNADLNVSGPDRVLGFEFSGEVVRVGTSGDPTMVGRNVLGIGEGTLAEYVVAHRRHVMAIPPGVSDTAAAAIPTAFTTELGAVTAGQVAGGETVLVTAASSSIGLIAVQVVKELGAQRVIATTRSADKRAALEAAGADVVLVTDNGGIADATMDVTDGVGADLVLDHIGGDALDTVIAAAAVGGTVVSVGRLSGGNAALDLFALARRYVQLRSVSFGLTPPEVLGDLFDAVTDVLVPAITAGRVGPVVGAVHGFDDAPAAIDRLRAGATAGKIVLTVP